ncbi:MAG: cytochrome c [Actinomycetota bacterium]
MRSATSASGLARVALPARLVLLVLAVVTLGACAGESPEVPLGPDGAPDEELSLGRDVYSRRCANCHGAGGGGGTGPKLSEGQVVVDYPDPADQRAVIANGRNAMPAFSGSLSTAEIDAVVRYTREVLSQP